MTIELGTCHSMEQKMLLNNEIVGILPCKLRSMDGGYVLDYQIDGMISLQELLEQTVVDKRIVQIFLEHLIQTTKQLHSYLLRLDGLSLEVDAIYIKGDWEQVKFCYIPNQEQNLIEQLTCLFENFMKQLDHKEEKTVLFVYNIYRLLGESNTSLATIEQFLIQEKRKNEQEEVEAVPIIRVEPHWKEEELQEESQKLIEREIEEKRPKKGLYLCLQIGSGFLSFLLVCFSFYFARKRMWKNVAIGLILLAITCYTMIERKKEKESSKEQKETSQEEDKTILLSHTVQKENQTTPYLRLISDSRENEIVLSHTPLILGSLTEAVDRVVEGKGISRIHLSIEQESGEYYIRDLNSTNGTYCNGELLMPQVPKKLKESDQIFLGDQQYQFCFK